MWRADIHLDPVAETDVYTQQIARLKAENATLQAQLQRAMKELKAYQLQYPSAVLPDESTADEGILPPWVLSPEAMNPLLQAYDTRIRELTHTVDQQKQELQGMARRAEQLVIENETMRQQQVQHLSDIGADGQPRAGGQHLTTLVDQANLELTERVAVLEKEYSVLIDQATVLHKEVDKWQQHAALVEQDRDELSRFLKDATTKVDQLEHQVRTLTDEKSSCEARWRQLSTEHGALETAHNDKSTELSAAKDKIDVLEAQLQELQRELREVGQRYDKELHERYLLVKSTEERVRELQAELARRTHDGDSAREAAKKYKRELDATRKDAVGMVQVMEGLERQLKLYADNEQRADSVVRAANERVEKALLVSEQARAAEKTQRNENERLRAELRADVADSAQTELRNFERLKQPYAAQTRQLEHKVQELSVAIVDLKAERDRAVQEAEFANRRAKAVLEQVDNRQTQEHEVVVQLGKERQTLAERLREETERRLAAQEAVRELREGLDNDRFSWAAERQSLQEILRTKQLEATTLQTDNRRLAEALAEQRREHLSTEHRLQQRIADLTVQLKIAEDKRRDLLEQNSEKVATLETSLRESETQIESLMLNSQRTTQKIMQAHSGSIEQLEARLSQKDSVVTNLTAKVQELNLQIRALTEERQELKELLVEKQEQIEHLEQSARAFEGIVSGLSGQLSHNLEARQQQARSAARLHAELALRSGRFPIFQEDPSPISSERSYSHHSHDPLEKDVDAEIEMNSAM